MEPSTELKELMLQFYQWCNSGDVAAVQRCISAEEGALLIGTDPAEWWTGHATITRLLGTAIREMGGMKMIAGNPQAFRAGSVGWVADNYRLRLPDGAEIPLRLTIVFEQEHGAWKIVQYHHSIGVADEETIGKPPPQ
jgi:hypothetical protein